MDKILLNPAGNLHIKIRALPVDGKANEYLIEYLATVFGLPKKNIEIVSGFTSSHKRINIVAEEHKIKTILQKL